MNVGIVGLGLIGGSFAKAYKAAGHTVYALEADESIMQFAILSGAADASLDVKSLQSCSLLLIALYPRAAMEFLDEMARHIPPGTMVIDCCGTKASICAVGFEAARRHGFSFVGGHPMAGIERSGFKYSKADMFKGASMIIVPPIFDDIMLLDGVKRLLAPARFGRLTITTAEKHDAMIAYTSQLAHLVSNAYMKSPAALEHEGFSAGSYKDLTRVAWLNERMWAELFIENRDNLLNELDLLLGSLGKFKEALQCGDLDGLQALLLEGKLLKEEVDRRCER